MKKQEILESLHKGLQATVGSMALTEDGIQDAEKNVVAYLHAMGSVSRLVEPTRNLQVVKELSVAKSEVSATAVLEKEVEEAVTYPVGEIVEEGKGKYFLNGQRVYKFNRKIYGGDVDGKDCFIPENIVRKLDLEHGDYIYVEENGVTLEGKAKHMYSVAKHGERIPREGNEVVKMVVLKYDSLLERYFVDEDMNGNLLKLGEVPYPFYISRQEVQKKGVKTGDVVDIAYVKHIPTMVVIQWKHYSDEPEYTVEAVKCASKKVKKEKKEYPQTLEGKRVVAVGLEPRKGEMEEEVVKRGGEFQWIHGKKGDVATTESAVKNADVVVLYLQHIGHGGTGKGSIGVVELAKQYGVPFESLDNFGRSSFTRTVHEGLGIELQEAVAVGNEEL
ncbi:DUF2325 domain-containing protein [Bacillus thuringiensis]|uniref:DUF2325 domain-containing protein n=1 Tax=Bacillus thuringiensis TaxID=1428 RepID=UPI000BFCC97B|nr:DUF2325 domain-containing protein [Bacillus thuringiensis]PGT89879.1 hypothetical protein COD17_09010 [Bacillus thuringiensis]